MGKPRQRRSLAHARESRVLHPGPTPPVARALHRQTEPVPAPAGAKPARRYREKNGADNKEMCHYTLRKYRGRNTLGTVTAQQRGLPWGGGPGEAPAGEGHRDKLRTRRGWNDDRPPRSLDEAETRGAQDRSGLAGVPRRADVAPGRQDPDAGPGLAHAISAGCRPAPLGPPTRGLETAGAHHPPRLTACAPRTGRPRGRPRGVGPVPRRPERPLSPAPRQLPPGPPRPAPRAGFVPARPGPGPGRSAGPAAAAAEC